MVKIRRNKIVEVKGQGQSIEKRGECVFRSTKRKSVSSIQQDEQGKQYFRNVERLTAPIAIPPSTLKQCPVMYEPEGSVARNRTKPATSSGNPKRLRGMKGSNASLFKSYDRRCDCETTYVC